MTAICDECGEPDFLPGRFCSLDCEDAARDRAYEWQEAREGAADRLDEMASGLSWDREQGREVLR